MITGVNVLWDRLVAVLGGQSFNKWPRLSTFWDQQALHLRFGIHYLNHGAHHPLKHLYLPLFSFPLRFPVFPPHFPLHLLHDSLLALSLKPGDFNLGLRLDISSLILLFRPVTPIGLEKPFELPIALVFAGCRRGFGP